MNEADFIWMNGEIVRWQDARVHVLTHALHYGTGVFEGIRAYETERGTAVFLNSHLLTEVEMVCDRVAIVDHGKVVASGTLDDLLGGGKVLADQDVHVRDLRHQTPPPYNRDGRSHCSRRDSDPDGQGFRAPRTAVVLRERERRYSTPAGQGQQIKIRGGSPCRRC